MDLFVCDFEETSASKALCGMVITSTDRVSDVYERTNSYDWSLNFETTEDDEVEEEDYNYNLYSYRYGNLEAANLENDLTTEESVTIDVQNGSRVDAGADDDHYIYYDAHVPPSATRVSFAM